MNILVLEGKKLVREKLVKTIEKNFWDYRVYSTKNVREAREIIKKKRISVFFLDIDLQDRLGIEFAKDIIRDEKYALTKVILVTEEEKYILDNLKTRYNHDFLNKNFEEDKIIDIINLFKNGSLSSIKEGKSIIFNISNTIKTKIFLEDIIFIQYIDRNCILRTKNGKVLAKGYGLQKLLEIIDDENIIRCHKAFALNKNYIEDIKKIDKKYFEVNFFSCEDIIPIGYKYKDLVLEKTDDLKIANA